MAVPSSTYRLQITEEFDLDTAADLVDYLARLGVGAVYCSPLLTAAAGSAHGYDVVDHSRIDPARGGSEAWRRLVERAQAAGLSIVVDIVPNHMGVADASENAAWWDVLQHGPLSDHAAWFDIDWSQGRLRLPVLGDGDASAELRVEDGELRYFEHRFPLAPGTEAGTPAEVHARQHYELVNFRRADHDLAYRRFFAISSLAGLRVEDESVFEATHREILRWVAEDGVAGLRIDHPDGLADPGGYLDGLAARAPGTWITVEKILEPGELLPSSWPVAGTTGYDALAEVMEVLLDADDLAAADRLYRELVDERDFSHQVAAGKREIATSILGSEVARLRRLVPDIAAAEQALVELLVAFPVYRSYAPLGIEHLERAARTAIERRPDLAAAVDSLLPRLSDPTDELCRRFEQTSGPVMAKGVEDTAYYRYNRLVALNEVGADPGLTAPSVDAFHTAQQRRQARHPHGLTTLSTHDTKRSEDVRARILVLAELAEPWRALVDRLTTEAPVPDPALAQLLWQTLIGSGFIERERMHAYAEKAMREAHTGTGWIDPDEQFERSVHEAIERAYFEPELRRDVEALIALVTPYGWTNALSQKLIQLTMPGVPDVYQGTELWDDSLVDPDNRRPVDYAQRRRHLADMDA
ncbi:MAG: malto-oligosyltrehalose synthase, partial [Actinobacteria bacterium]|nr:malto-oligosyltrehalose synthase [Actinomycetota bacterium]